MRFIPVVLLAILLAFVGCSKKDEDIEALEREAAEDQAAAVMDSLNRVEKDSIELAQTPLPGQANKTKPPVVYEESPTAREAGFVIQVGSYQNYDIALLMEAKYKERGYPAFIKRTDLDDGMYYRLRIGVYETKPEAEQVAKVLVDHYSAQYWIDWNR